MFRVLFLSFCVLFPSGRYPGKSPETIQVDMIEFNHYYKETGELAFSQIIYWRQYREGLHVCAWRLVPEDTCIEKRGGYYTDVIVNKRFEKLCIRSRVFRETHTDYDPEQLDRAKFAESLREFPYINRHRMEGNSNQGE